MDADEWVFKCGGMGRRMGERENFLESGRLYMDDCWLFAGMLPDQ